MTTELVKIDPKEFGLEESNVATIEQAFAPKIIERDALSVIYESVITKELTPALCKEASDLRKQLVKVRTGIADIHKTQKAFFLAAGRFVDAWKNKETAPVEQMEEKLSEIEKYFENIEKQRITDLEQVRKDELSQFTDVFPSGLGYMEQSVYDNYLVGVKLAYEARIEAERKAEAERVAEEKRQVLNNERKAKTIRLVEFIENYESVFFGDMSEEDFMAVVNLAIEKRTAQENEQARIKAENERLQKEAEEKEKALETERKKQAEILQKQQAEAARIQAEKDAENARLLAQIKVKEDAERAAKLEAERIETERLKQQAEAAKAPVKQKAAAWVESFSIAEFSEQNAITDDIKLKFESFKKWAAEQVNKI